MTLCCATPKHQCTQHIPPTTSNTGIRANFRLVTWGADMQMRALQQHNQAWHAVPGWGLARLSKTHTRPTSSKSHEPLMGYPRLSTAGMNCNLLALHVTPFSERMLHLGSVAFSSQVAAETSHCLIALLVRLADSDGSIEAQLYTVSCSCLHPSVYEHHRQKLGLDCDVSMPINQPATLASQQWYRQNVRAFANTLPAAVSTTEAADSPAAGKVMQLMGASHNLDNPC